MLGRRFGRCKAEKWFDLQKHAEPLYTPRSFRQSFLLWNEELLVEEKTLHPNAKHFPLLYTCTDYDEAHLGKPLSAPGTFS